ncbi:MAG: membrane protease YdiL (CAAX protease family) [Myxococcota bacterium]
MALLGSLSLVILQTPALEAWGRLTGTQPLIWYDLLDWDGPLQAAGIFAAIAVIAPICEELFFRGYLLDRFARLGPAVAIALQAGLFALYHGDLYGLPVYLVSGVALGVLRLASGSLVPAMVLHAGNNALGILEIVRGTAFTEGLGSVGIVGSAGIVVGLAVAGLAIAIGVLDHRRREKRIDQAQEHQESTQ